MFSLWSESWTSYFTQRQVNSMTSSSVCSACRNRAVSLGIPAEEVGRECSCFTEIGEYNYKVGAVEGSGLQGSRGSGMDSEEAKGWLCFKDLSPPCRQNIRCFLYSVGEM